MKLRTNIKWLLIAGLVILFANTSYGYAQDTTTIRKLTERASELYLNGNFDSSQLLSGRANKLVNDLLHDQETKNTKTFLDHVKVQKARALDIFAMSIESKQTQAAIDSLNLALDLMKETGNISEQASLYSSIAIIYDSQVQNERALEYHKKSIALFRETNNLDELAVELTNIGITYRNMGNYGEAMESLLESLDIFRGTNDSTNVVETLLAMGFVYMYVERWDDALKVQQQALEIYRGLNDSLGIARIYNDMGAVNMAAGNYLKALDQHKKALKIRLNSNEYYYTYASYHYIGRIYEKLEELDQALSNYESSLEYARRTGSRVTIIDARNNIGEVQFKRGDYNRAMEQFKIAETMSKEIEDGTGRARALLKIAEIYQVQNNPSKALESLKLAGEAVPNSDFIVLEEIYSGIAKAYEQLGDYRNAFMNMELYANVKDSVTKVENLEKVTSLTNRLEFENRQALQRESQEKMIQLKQAQIDRQKIVRNFILFGMAVILVLAVIYYVRFVEKNKLNKKLNRAFTDLKSTQAQLIHAEKMASLGELSAGIAHEIQNPLNFVNNFSEVNRELISELKEEIENGNLEEVKGIAGDLEQNEEKISHHGKRADDIVKGMLQHSRKSSGQKEPIDLNALADEYLRLSYHGLRAKNKSFNADFKLEADPELPKINVVPQDIGRVLLNLINNAFYAVADKAKHSKTGYKPAVIVTTKKLDGKINILVKDNGNGIPESVKAKIFQPFFTTKPSGEGTGLGLSMSYDIIIKGHGGNLHVETKQGEGTQFIIELPTD